MTSIIVFVPCLGGSELIDNSGATIWPLTGDNYKSVLLKIAVEFILNYGSGIKCDSKGMWNEIKSGAINFWDEFKTQFDYRSINLMPDSLLDLLMSPNTRANGKIVKKMFAIDIYSDIISELAGAGFDEDENLFLFGYDFRKSIPTSSLMLNKYVTSVIDMLTAKGASIKDVTMIGHSLGCMVIKDFIQDYAANVVIQNQLLKNVIFIGAPTYGTLDALSSICSSGREIFMTSRQLARIANNFDSVSCLVPSKYSLFDARKGEFLDLSVIKDLNMDPNVRALINFDKLKSGYEYAQLASESTIPDFINVYQLVGCIQESTPCMIKWMGNKFEVEMQPCGGDGVIPVENAINRSKDSFVYFIPASHVALANDETTIKIIGSILTNQARLTPFSYFDEPGKYPKPLDEDGEIVPKTYTVNTKLRTNVGSKNIAHDFFSFKTSLFQLDNVRTFYDGRLYTYKFNIVIGNDLINVSSIDGIDLNANTKIARVEVKHNTLDIHNVQLKHVEIENGELVISTRDAIGYGIWVVYASDKTFRIVSTNGDFYDTNIAVGHFLTKSPL
jgi:hypothetical protein